MNRLSSCVMGVVERVCIQGPMGAHNTRMVFTCSTLPGAWRGASGWAGRDGRYKPVGLAVGTAIICRDSTGVITGALARPRESGLSN